MADPKKIIGDKKFFIHFDLTWNEFKEGQPQKVKVAADKVKACVDKKMAAGMEFQPAIDTCLLSPEKTRLIQGKVTIDKLASEHSEMLEKQIARLGTCLKAKDTDGDAKLKVTAKGFDECLGGGG
jgi:hypothetical protein